MGDIEKTCGNCHYYICSKTETINHETKEVKTATTNEHCGYWKMKLLNLIPCAKWLSDENQARYCPESWVRKQPVSLVDRGEAE